MGVISGRGRAGARARRGGRVGHGRSPPGQPRPARPKLTAPFRIGHPAQPAGRCSWTRPGLPGDSCSDFTIAAAVGPISLLVISTDAGRRPARRPGVRPGRGVGRRDLWRNCRVRPDRDHECARGWWSPAGHCRRHLPVVARLADHPQRAGHGRGRRAPERAARRLPVDPGPDPYESDSRSCRSGRSSPAWR